METYTSNIIPEMGDDFIWDRWKQVHPIIRGRWMNEEIVDLKFLRNCSYLWNQCDEGYLLEDVNYDELKHYLEVRCLHTCGYYGLFKPSIYEVLSQIPSQYFKEAHAFEIVDSPKDLVNINNQQKYLMSIGLDTCYHISTVRWYKKR